MNVAALKESPDPRVAIVPSTVAFYIKKGFQICLEKDAGLSAEFSDESYKKQGASFYPHRKKIIEDARILLLLNPLSEAHAISPETLIIAPIESHLDHPFIKIALKQGFSVFSTDLIPRIGRTQSMDILSSQASLSGYRAMLQAIFHYKRAVPMMMTAAGTITPAKVLVMGAGVAGLQAIATAKRLGAIVYAFDVRQAAKEQVESLGGIFIDVETNETFETTGGYARETHLSYQKRQEEKIELYLQTVDIVICTAQIPGKKAPILLHQKNIEKMKPHSIIVDITTATGGNTTLSKPDQTVLYKTVTIIGLNMAATLIPTTASELLSHNFLHIVRLLTNTSLAFSFDEKDEIIQNAMVCHQKEYFPFKRKQGLSS